MKVLQIRELRVMLIRVSSTLCDDKYEIRLIFLVYGNLSYISDLRVQRTFEHTMCVVTWCVQLRGSCSCVVRAVAWCVQLRGASSCVVRSVSWCVQLIINKNLR